MYIAVLEHISETPCISCTRTYFWDTLYIAVLEHIHRTSLYIAVLEHIYKTSCI